MNIFSRPLLLALYGFDSLLLAFLIYLASDGQFVVPTKHGMRLLEGWAAWAACLFPISSAAAFAARYDPAISLSNRWRMALFIVFSAVGVVAIFFAFQYSRPY